jgi:hypothetical protein
MRARVVACLLLAPLGAQGATIRVPSQQPTIQKAVTAAHAGDVILVAPGSYKETVHVTGARASLTIEADTPEDPPVILGTPDGDADGIRDDAVNGLTLRHLRILGAYDGVRLNYVKQAVLEGLDIENSALGIRVNHGGQNIVSECTVLGTRVEQGILVYYSPGSVVSGTISAGTARENIRVANSAGAVLDHDQVSASDGSDGAYVSTSPGAQVTSCTVTTAYHSGIRVINSPGLVLTNNTSTDNLNDGFLIMNSPPYTSVADVLAGGNVASGNQVAIDIH